MRRPLIVGIGTLVVAGTLAATVVAQTAGEPVGVPPAQVQPYLVRSGDTSFNAIGERLCGVANRTVVGAQIQRMNPGAGTLTIDEALEVPTHCPAPVPTTTSTVAATTTTSTVSPTTTAAPTTTAGATTTVATTTTAPATTTSTTTVPSTAPPSGGGFSATFETAADFYDRFDLDVHFRNPDGTEYGDPFPGDHDMACGSPTTQRQVHAEHAVDGVPNGDLRTSELFWWCAPGSDPARGHMMTGMGDIDGYTILSFSPKQTFDGIRKICWDVNKTDLGGRKWTQMLVVPEAVFQANGGRLDYISPVTQGVDQGAIAITSGVFMFANSDHKFRMWQGQNELVHDWRKATTNDKAARYPHCLVDNEDGTVTMSDRRGGDGAGLPPAQQWGEAGPDGWFRLRVGNGHLWGDEVYADLPDGPARVIFQDDNYTPEKDGPIQGYTWHWDNITVEVE